MRLKDFLNHFFLKKNYYIHASSYTVFTTGFYKKTTQTVLRSSRKMALNLLQKLACFQANLFASFKKKSLI